MADSLCGAQALHKDDMYVFVLFMKSYLGVSEEFVCVMLL